ncbi:type VI secretion system Vgr family protein [Pseudoduganella umbonata]|uniref:Type VI secretion system VgrG family protein n=1 Tax=Pseudoduganella umbonata TaxID=864828 RepID=A0A4P8HUC6_9BURK|nr:type VI secretion system Vgr family protein [Pseudoduganella umbonata]MBB3222146.1 type VI secretion system VgrG family protein [Pseudoduganella umbonata]QCP12382.1 type VI secretion system tip protein VgrG [Pseudoduganella umbonata]
MLALPDLMLRQDTRILQLSTPLGPNRLIPECLRAQEAISQPYELKVTALSTDAGIALKSLLGQPVLLELLTATHGQPRPFHGYVTAAGMLGADGGLARYELTIGPWYAFMELGRDSRVFQDMTVFDILDTLFASWQGPGKLVPQWRYDIADRTIYPQRSLTCQYQESNRAFAERLMHEEGLFYYFEHSGEPDSSPFGSHRLVIADHNGAFQPAAQSTLRFTQPGAVMREDSMDRWRREVRGTAGGVDIGSWDYRGLGMRRAAAEDGAGPVLRDTPGAYAYTSPEHGQRIADRQLEALRTSRETFVGAGTVRTLVPGTTFTLREHAAVEENETFAVLRVLHLAHNNLSAEVKDAAQRLGEHPLARLIEREQAGSLHATGKDKGERPLYRNRIDAIRSSVPYRSTGRDGHGLVLRPKPTIRGQQTAIVVGPPGAVIHTDRDHRIKVQFHWQRGAQSHSRLDHPAPDGHAGAPADDRSGTWVRIATPMAPVAGANWGAVAVPRVGSEVLVDFIDGDIDRPIVIGSLYNGGGEADAQHNRINAGTGAATGNAPAWFPGASGAHAHAAVLSGFKSQALQTSRSGTGAYNQLVFDDSPAEPRVALQRHAGAHEGTDELNLGHLRHQADNQRLDTAGFGAELKTAHGAALRAGQGLLLSTEAQTAGGQQLDARAAVSQIGASAELMQSLADTAQKHNAKLKSEPEPAKLPAIAELRKGTSVLDATAGGGGADEGGGGNAIAFTEPQLQLSSPAGIAATTPASTIVSAGTTTSFAAGQDINVASQANLLHQVKGGIGLFTYGKASAATKPNQETGIRLHAASGKASVQAQSDAVRVTADKMVTVASVGGSVSVSGKAHVMLTAQGASLKIEGGNITIQGPGTMAFKASKKELAGPLSVSSVDIAHKVGELNIKRDLEIEYVDADGNVLTDEPIAMQFSNGTDQGITLDASGKATIKNAPLGPFHAKQPRRK